MKKIISILLCIFMFVSVCPVAVLAVDGGDGSTEDLPSSAIAISNVDELVMICNEYPADGYYYLTGDIDLSYALGEYGDYYNDGKGWEPIGNSNTPFKGTFDGRGYTIKGLSINRPEQNCIGLFGYAENATFKNCKLETVDIKGASYVGGLLGRGMNIVLKNSEITNGSIIASSCGGLVGSAETITITKCKSDTLTVSGTDTTGGLLGFCTELTCVDCTVSNGDTKSKGICAGGIVGEVSSSCNIEKCTNSNSVSALSSGSKCGGIVGNCFGAVIKECTNDSKVSADTVGGIVGSFKGTLVDSCKNNGFVFGTSTNLDYHHSKHIAYYSEQYHKNIDYYDYYYEAYGNAGGIAGSFKGDQISSCQNNANVSLLALTRSTSFKVGNYYAYGSDYFYTTYFQAGGIVGEGSIKTISGCQNTGKITSSVNSVDYPSLYSTKSSLCSISSATNSTLENCYNFSSSPSFKSSGTAKNCYSISSFTAENGTVWLSDGSAVTRTNKQMRLKSTFEGFDFENTYSYRSRYSTRHYNDGRYAHRCLPTFSDSSGHRYRTFSGRVRSTHQNGTLPPSRCRQAL